MSKNVLVIGSINVDYVIHTERLPKLGETLVGSGFAINCGGKGANQAVALAKAGCCVKMFGAVGKDFSAELSVKNLEASGVDCSAVMRVDAPTGAAVITVCGGDNHILLDEGANGFVTPNTVEAHADLFDWADVLVMQYEVPIASVITAARMAHERGKTVILNPAPVKDVDKVLYQYIDILIPNEFEAGLITGIEQNTDADAKAAIAALKQLGCGNAIVTLGGAGSAYGVGDDVHFAGIYDVERVDTTAAGDSFIGGLCAKLCEGWDLDSAVPYASAVSAITVSRAGAAVSIPLASETEEFLKTHRIGMHQSR